MSSAANSEANTRDRGRRGPRGITSQARAAIAADLLNTTDTKRVIAERHSVTYDKVRTVQQQLERMMGPLDREVSALSGLPLVELLARAADLQARLGEVEKELASRDSDLRTARREERIAA